MRLFITTIFALSSFVTASVPVVSMVDSPGEIDLLHSEKIEVSKGLTRSSTITCQLVLKAPPKHHILLHINSVNINTTSKYEGLDIFDGIRRTNESLYGDRLTEASLKGQYVDNLASENTSEFRDFTSSGRYMTIILYAYLTPQNPGFNITAVPYMEPEDDVCTLDYFLCETNHLCINNASKCDGNMDCGLGDTSDEDCMTTVPNRKKVLTGGLAGGGAIIIVVVVIVICYRCKKQNRKRENDVLETPEEDSSELGHFIQQPSDDLERDEEQEEDARRQGHIVHIPVRNNNEQRPRNEAPVHPINTIMIYDRGCPIIQSQVYSSPPPLYQSHENRSRAPAYESNVPAYACWDTHGHNPPPYTATTPV